MLKWKFLATVLFVAVVHAFAGQFSHVLPSYHRRHRLTRGLVERRDRCTIRTCLRDVGDPDQLIAK